MMPSVPKMSARSTAFLSQGISWPLAAASINILVARLSADSARLGAPASGRLPYCLGLDLFEFAVSDQRDVVVRENFRRVLVC